MFSILITEKALVDAIEKVLSMGYKIIPERWHDPKRKECCPIGAFLIVKGKTFTVADKVIFGWSQEAQKYIVRSKIPYDEDLLKLFGDPRNVWSFIRGLDPDGDYDEGYSNGEWFGLGRKLRERYIK